MFVYKFSCLFTFHSVACSACSLGFIQATLEPHLRDFHLSPLIVGSLFVVSGGTYGKNAFWNSSVGNVKMILYC